MIKKRNYTCLLGRGRIEVKDKLGYGFNCFSNDVWNYKLGKTWIGRRIILFIIFKDEKVAEINVIRKFGK